MNNDPFGQGADLFEPDPERPVLDATFEDFLRRNKPLFFKVALNRLQDRQDADEALSDASVAMYQKWERIRVHAKPDALAMRILIDKITDFYRARARHTKREQSVIEQLAAVDVTEMRNQDRLDRALEALRKISPQQADCLEMYKLLGKSYHEIAQDLGITYNAAKTAASRGQTRLKALLAEPSETEKGDS